jgi:hypothetical protein
MNPDGSGATHADSDSERPSGDDYAALVEMMSQDVALYLKSRVDGFDVRQSIRAVDTGFVDKDGLPVIAVASSTEEAPRLLWQRMSAGFNQGLLLVRPKSRTATPSAAEGPVAEDVLSSGENLVVAAA